MKLGPPPTLDAALDEVRRVGSQVGGALARRLAAEVREIASALAEGKPTGPRGNAWRLEGARLKLAVVVVEREHHRLEALNGAKALAEQLPSLEREAADNADATAEVAALRRQLESAVGDEFESAKLGEKAGVFALETLGGIPIEGKALRDASGPWSSRKSKDFAAFIRRIGGYSADGFPPDGPLDFDSQHFCRAQDLIEGTEPESADERRAVSWWNKKYPAGVSA